MTELADVRPVTRYYLGLAADPYDALSTVVWTEVPNTQVKVRTLRWGAQHELARVEPSYCSLLLDNTGGDFEALNPASPYYPNLRPLNRLRTVDTWPANLLTANQESLESGTTGWAADTNCAIAQSILAAHSGIASLALTATAAGLMAARTPTGVSGIPVTAGDDYEAHLHARAGTGTMATSIVVRWYDAGGAFISDSGSNALDATATEFIPIGSVVTAPAGAAFAAVLPVMVAASAGDVGYLDSISFAPAGVRFTGYVTDWPRSWTGINQAVVQLEAWDALGAVLNAVDIPAWQWEMEVRKLIEELPATGKAVWLRLNETSGTVAADSSGFGIDGQYQGSPTLGQDGFTPDDDKAALFVTGSRASLPYKNLISDYPFSVASWFFCGTDLTGARMIFSAYDGPNTGSLQNLQILILSSGFGADAGKVVASVANPHPSGTTVKSTVTVNDGWHHLVVVAASSTDFKLYIDGVDRTAAVLTTAHSYPNDLITGYAVGNNPAAAFGDFRFGYSAGDVLDEVLILDGVALTAGQADVLYEAALGQPDLVNHTGQALQRLLDDLGWPAADRDIDSGLTVVQQGLVAGKALGYMQRLEVTEGGRLFVNGAGQIVFQDRHAVLQAPYTVSQATFGEDHAAGEIGYIGPFNHGEDDLDIRNDVRVGNVGGTVQVARSKASKDRYGWKTLSLTDLLGTSNEEARDRANRDLALYSEPVTRIRSITVKPQEDAAQGTGVWPALLGLGQNSRVTVKATPPGASLITQQSHVERLEETVTPKDWQVTLGLSAAQAGEAWIVGTSALDTGTVLAY